MRKILLKSAKTGMVLGKTIYSASGNALLAVGVALTPMFINRLNELGVPAVYVRDGLCDDIEIPEIISELTRVDAQKAVKDVFEQCIRSDKVNFNIVRNIANNLADEALSNREQPINLTDIRTYDDYNYGHSVNGALLAIMTGIALGYNQLQLRDLAVGVLLHDIGKVFINKELLNKPGKLTTKEFEEVKKHSAKGFEILKTHEEINLLTAHVAFQHHEKYDGSGYPRGLKGKDIHEYARIAALADVYDALTTERVYRKAYTPFQATQVLIDCSNSHFDPTLLKAFIQNIAVYPVGSIVTLTSGEIGVVIKTRREKTKRPLVRILTDKNKKRVSSMEEVDLTEKTELQVIKLLSEDDGNIPLIPRT
ncbi:MAG: HD-GYP domain-containing protein [Clostridia bacterium]|nr:HD-GYP domain-containing protein [Clostridia bacterium]